jgi:hypothetical protein
VTKPFLSFYNSLWLLFNDLVIGWSFGAFIIENKEVLSEIMFTKVEVTMVSPYRCPSSHAYTPGSNRTLDIQRIILARPLASWDKAQHRTKCLPFRRIWAAC